MPVVPLEARQKRGARASLQPLMDLVADDMLRVNATIVERMASRVSLIPQLAGHIVASGGKRLRPMLTLAAARLCGYQGDQHIKLAAVVEFIHTATLLHDDVVDQSDLRRGTSTANALWGNEASVLVGDFLFSRAFQMMVETGSSKVLGILANASAMIAEGEVLQLLTTNDTSTTEDAYLDVVAAKTAALFAATCRVSAVIANRGTDEEEALASYGRNLGIAFQFVDDVLDFAASESDMGKSVGGRFPGREDHFAGCFGISARSRGGANVLAPDSGSWRPGKRRSGTGDSIAPSPWRPDRYPGPRPPLWCDRPGRAGHLPRRSGKGRHAPGRRFLHQPGALILWSAAAPCG